MIGLLADPGLPARIARSLAVELPDVLAERVSNQVQWTVESVHEPFEVAYAYERVIDNARERVRGADWDIALCLTDIPMETDNGVVVADVSHQDCVALLSLPALGGLRLRRRARAVATAIIHELVGPGLQRADHSIDSAASALDSRLTRRVAPADSDVDIEIVMRAGAPRLLAGIVRANQPWQLTIGLSTALAGALAGSAFGILYAAVWKLATVLEPWRLAAGTLAAVTLLAVWLVVGHGLWERRPQRRRLRSLLNGATVLTIVSGVLVFFVALFLLNTAAAALIIPPRYLAEVVGSEVGVADYLRLALVTSGMGMVAGAVGSGLEDDDTVRRAAYSTREQVRRRQMNL